MSRLALPDPTGDTLEPTRISDLGSDSGDHDPAQSESHIVDWADDDPGNPFNWSLGQKWLITLTACYVCFIVGTNSTAISSASLQVLAEFDVSDVSFPNDYWLLTAWTAGAAFAPPVALPLMEHYGFRLSFLIYYGLFTISIIPQALAQNFATLIVVRVFAGALGGIVQNSVECTIADTWSDSKEQSLPITLFILVFVGSFTAGPVIGAGIASRLNWRWIFYIPLAVYAASFPFLFFIMKETRGTVLLGRRAKLLSRATGRTYTVRGASSTVSASSLLTEAILRPTRLFCTEPVVFFFTLWSAFALGLVFLGTQSIPQVYAANYGFSEIQSGYVQGAVLIGEVLGFLACQAQSAYSRRSALRNVETPGLPVPEAHLALSLPGSFFGLAGGLIVYAWTSQHPSLPWPIPAIGLGLIGFGIVIVVHAVVTYLTDSYVQYAGSAISAEAFGENVLSAFLPLSARSLYTNLGFPWASMLLAFAALLLTMAPLVLMLKGPSIRKRSKFISKAKRS